jgi:hypothetical protein
VSSRMARPAYDPWRDIEATHIPDGCGVKQFVEGDRLYGRRASAARSSVGVGATRVYVRFESEAWQISVRPHPRAVDRGGQP